MGRTSQSVHLHHSFPHTFWGGSISLTGRRKHAMRELFLHGDFHLLAVCGKIEHSMRETFHSFDENLKRTLLNREHIIRATHMNAHKLLPHRGTTLLHLIKN